MTNLEKEPRLDPPAEVSETECQWDLCAETQGFSDITECQNCPTSRDNTWYGARPELGMACYELHRLQHHDDEGLYALYLKAQKLEAFLNTMGGDIAQVLSGE